MAKFATAKEDKTRAFSTNVGNFLNPVVGTIDLPEEGSELARAGDFEEAGLSNREGRFQADKILNPIKEARGFVDRYSKAQEQVYGMPVVSTSAAKLLTEVIPADSEELALELGMNIPPSFSTAGLEGVRLLKANRFVKGFPEFLDSIFNNRQHKALLKGIDPTISWDPEEQVLQFADWRAVDVRDALLEFSPSDRIHSVLSSDVTILQSRKVSHSLVDEIKLQYNYRNTPTGTRLTDSAGGDMIRDSAPYATRNPTDIAAHADASQAKAKRVRGRFEQGAEEFAKQMLHPRMKDDFQHLDAPSGGNSITGNGPTLTHGQLKDIVNEHMQWIRENWPASARKIDEIVEEGRLDAEWARESRPPGMTRQGREQWERDQLSEQMMSQGWEEMEADMVAEILPSFMQEANIGVSQGTDLFGRLIHEVPREHLEDASDWSARLIAQAREDLGLDAEDEFATEVEGYIDQLIQRLRNDFGESWDQGIADNAADLVRSFAESRGWDPLDATTMARRSVTDWDFPTGMSQGEYNLALDALEDMYSPNPRHGEEVHRQWLQDAGVTRRSQYSPEASIENEAVDNIEYTMFAREADVLRRWLLPDLAPELVDRFRGNGFIGTHEDFDQLRSILRDYVDNIAGTELDPLSRMNGRDRQRPEDVLIGLTAGEPPRATVGGTAPVDWDEQLGQRQEILSGNLPPVERAPAADESGETLQERIERLTGRVQRQEGEGPRDLRGEARPQETQAEEIVSSLRQETEGERVFNDLYRDISAVESWTPEEWDNLRLEINNRISGGERADDVLSDFRSFYLGEGTIEPLAGSITSAVIPRVYGERSPMIVRREGGFRNGAIRIGADPTEFIETALYEHIDELPSLRLDDTAGILFGDSEELTRVHQLLEELFLEDLQSNGEVLDDWGREQAGILISKLATMLGL
jgi:hypothetical protein